MRITRDMAITACYCRVSSRHQKNDSQRVEIERWLKNHNVDRLVVRWFEDKESGNTTHRLAFRELERGVFEGTIRTVVVWKLDRLSRLQRDGINLLADWCERGVRVVSVTQQIDLSGAVGRMVTSVMFGLAEIEFEYGRERQAAGIAVAKRKGVGRRGPQKQNPSRAKALSERGLTVAEIANAIAVCERTVFRYLAETRA
ncbi:MAG: recombinase family protein [Gammaproteobacteria bacterium]